MFSWMNVNKLLNGIMGDLVGCEVGAVLVMFVGE